MSKAFTRESDDAAEDPNPRRPLPTLPAGAKNYLTPDGAIRLRTELARLIEAERPNATGLADEAERRAALRAIDLRIQRLEAALESATVVGPPADPAGPARFGALITVRDPAGERTEYRIVGVDEADADRGWVSWLSPIAKALLNSRVGQRVRFRFPSGEDELEIVAIDYPVPPASPGAGITAIDS